MPTCPACAEPVREDAKRCLSCGRSLAQVDPRAASAAEPTRPALVLTMDGAAYEKLYLTTANLLQRHGDMRKAADALVADGLAEHAAQEITGIVHRDIKAHNRKMAFNKMIGSGILLAIFGAIYLVSGVLFYIILPLAAIGFVWGLAGLFITSGCTMEAEDGDD